MLFLCLGICVSVGFSSSRLTTCLTERCSVQLPFCIVSQKDITSTAATHKFRYVHEKYTTTATEHTLSAVICKRFLFHSHVEWIVIGSYHRCCFWREPFRLWTDKSGTFYFFHSMEHFAWVSPGCVEGKCYL